MGNIVDIARVFSRIRNRHRVTIFVKVYVGPGFLGRVVLIFVVGGNFGWTRIRGNVAAVYSLLAGVVALGESRSKRRKKIKHTRAIRYAYVCI